MGMNTVEMYSVDSDMFYCTTALEFREERTRLLPYEGREEQEGKKEKRREQDQKSRKRGMNERGRDRKKRRTLGKVEKGMKEGREGGKKGFSAVKNVVVKGMEQFCTRNGWLLGGSP